MSRRVLALFAIAFALALSAVWGVHRRSVDRSLSLVHASQIRASLSEAREMSRAAYAACADEACRQSVREHVNHVERDLLALEELDVLGAELRVSVAIYGAGPMVALFAVAYVALMLWLRRLFDPLRDASNAALRYAEGDERSFPIAVDGPAEVRALATALNRMTSTIRRQSVTLAAQSRSLGWHEIAREVVHEGRNLLTPLRLGAEGLAERAVESDDATLERESKRLLGGLAALERMLASLKDLTTRRFPQMQRLDVADVLRSVTAIHDREGTTLDLDVAARSEVIGDADLLAEAVGNMIVNAFEAGAKRVAVSARPVGTDVVIACVDDGEGIPKENVGRAAMLGFSTKPEGSGFGLYFASKFATQLGGRMEVESTVGTGTSVRMVIPDAHP